MASILKGARAPKNNGFTLVEMLAVIAIIGILASVVFANLGSSREYAKNKYAISVMQEMIISATLYKANNGNYSNICTNDTFDEDFFGDINDAVGKTPTCDSSNSGYEMQLELLDGSLYCIDSNKYFGYTASGDDIATHSCQGV